GYLASRPPALFRRPPLRPHGEGGEPGPVGGRQSQQGGGEGTQRVSLFGLHLSGANRGANGHAVFRISLLRIPLRCAASSMGFRRSLVRIQSPRLFFSHRSSVALFGVLLGSMA